MPQHDKFFNWSNRIPGWAKAGLSAAGSLALLQIARSAAKKSVDLNGKTVLITGSRGLGLALAFEFGHQGSRVALCARNGDELEEARKRLAREGIEAAAFPCDVTKNAEIDPLVDRVLERFGQIDILVNNAGDIQVGPLESFDHSDFEHAMDLMFWAPVNLALAILPHMKRRGSGHIVNITSIGGRVSVPHLLPYCCAKFALVGFSNGLSAEARGYGIHVLTAVPGLMRTGSYLHASFKGKARDEFAWFALLGNAPGLSVGATYAARCIRRGVEKRAKTCTISLPAKLLVASEALLPDTTRAVLAGANRFVLPGSNGSKQAIEGRALNPTFGRLFQACTSLGKRAAYAFNEEIPRRV
jgi:NAD(P)-dependent dehydrogenase (short-subunit alcohol dehydrogenase family)